MSTQFQDALTAIISEEKTMTGMVSRMFGMTRQLIYPQAKSNRKIFQLQRLATNLTNANAELYENRICDKTRQINDRVQRLMAADAHFRDLKYAFPRGAEQLGPRLVKKMSQIRRWCSAREQALNHAESIGVRKFVWISWLKSLENKPDMFERDKELRKDFLRRVRDVKQNGASDHDALCDIELELLNWGLRLSRSPRVTFLWTKFREEANKLVLDIMERFDTRSSRAARPLQKQSNERWVGWVFPTSLPMQGDDANACLQNLDEAKQLMSFDLAPWFELLREIARLLVRISATSMFPDSNDRSRIETFLTLWINGEFKDASQMQPRFYPLLKDFQTNWLAAKKTSALYSDRRTEMFAYLRDNCPKCDDATRFFQSRELDDQKITVVMVSRPITLASAALFDSHRAVLSELGDDAAPVVFHGDAHIENFKSYW